MQSINKVEIQGVIGSVRVVNTVYSDSNEKLNVYRFCVATNYAYRPKDGMPVIETTWHNVSITEKSENELDWLAMGKYIHITGHISNRNFVGTDGHIVTIAEIIADDLHTINN